MEADAGFPFRRVHGTVLSANDFLMQFQSDVLGCELHRPACLETTALGAAYLAGLSTGFWKGTAELSALRENEKDSAPQMDGLLRDKLLHDWRDAAKWS